MKFPIEEVACAIIGYLISATLGYCFLKITKKYDIGVSRILKHLPTWLWIIYLPLIILCVPFFCWCFCWGFYAYNYLISGNVKEAILAFALNVLGMLYISVIAKDLPEKKR